MEERRNASLPDARIVRALRAHEHWSAAALFALLIVIYLWPALVEGGLLSPTALLYSFPPWPEFAPAGIERWVNGDLGDVPFTYYPWSVLAREFIHAGTFPAWNPYAFGGTPLFANSQIAWLSPFSVPLWVFPLHSGLAVAAALKLWAAGFGTYLLTRELRLGFLSGVVSGVSFALCSFNVVWLSYSVFVSVAVMLPWALWLVERLVRRGRPGSGLALAAVLAIALLGGHPGTQVHVLAATFLYAVLRSVTVRELDARQRAERLALVGGAAVIALLLAAVVLLPAHQAAIDTAGAEVRKDGAPLFPGSMMPFEVVRTIAFPEWWGRPSEGVFAGPGPAGYRERTFYAGTVTLVLALIALCSPGGWRRKAPFAVIGALGLAISLRLPGLHDLVIALPGFDRVQNSRIYLWLVFVVAILGGFGAQRVFDARGRLGRTWAVPVVGLLAAIVAAGSLALEGQAWQRAVEHLISRTTTEAPDVLALASVLRWTLLVIVLAGFVAFVRRVPRARPLAACAVALVVTLDLFQFAHGYQPMGPPDKVVPPRTPAIAYLEGHRDDGRIAGVASLPADWPTIFRLRDVGGSDAPLPTNRFFRLWRTMDPSADPYSLRNLTELSPRILGLLGARYVMAPPGSSATGPLRPVYAEADATIFENALSVPRAFVARARIASSEEHEYAMVAEANFDPRRDAIVRADQLDTAPSDAASGGSARIIAEHNDEVTLHATLEKPEIVVLGDTWGKGWSVTVDGRDATPLEANIVLRGVAVAAGTHEIVWRYRVPGLRLGAALTIFGLMGAVGWAGAMLVFALRRTRAQSR